MEDTSKPPPLPVTLNKPSLTLVIVTLCLAVVNVVRGFAEGMIRSHSVSHALGSATFCLVFPLGVALLFSIGRGFRNPRSAMKVALWTTVVMLLAGVGTLAQGIANQNLRTTDRTEEAGEQNQAIGAATNAPASPDADAVQLAKVFPALYWHASDACLRETTRHGFGHPQKYDEFVTNNVAVIEKFEAAERRGLTRCTMRLRLHDSKSPEEYWVLELTRESNKWEPKAGHKFMDGKQAFDLFQDEHFAGIKVMGSMKPYFQRALAAYSEGKDPTVVFKK